MKRLVYSPKAFVYVMSDNPPPDLTAEQVLSRKSLANTSITGGPYLHNISDLVVSGNVTRKVNQVSTAEVTFRNPNRIYTKPGNPVFRPMDAITIFLQRLPGCPVQVFTGYLDSTPYFQMYPGTATMTASCTLKRLMHTYFDPGLPFTRTFMAKYGWFPDADNSMSNRQRDKDQKGQPVDQVQDSNLSELLFAVMKNIGNWTDDTIHVEKLPDRLLNRISDLYTIISDNNTEASDEFEAFLKDFVGTAGYNGQDSGGGSSAKGGPKEFREAANSAADKYGVDASVLMGIASVESDFGRNPATQRGGAGSSAGAQGPMQFMPATWDTYGVDANGDGTKDIFDVKDAVYGAANLLSHAGFKQDKRKAIFAYNHLDSYVDEVLRRAETYKAENADQDNRPTKQDASQNNQDNHRSGNDPNPSDDSADASKSGGKKKRSDDPRIYAPIAGGPTKISSPYGEKNHGNPPHTHMGIDVPTPMSTDIVAPADGRIGNFSQTTGFGSAGGMIHFVFTKDTGDIKAGTVIGWGHVSEVFKSTGESVKAGKVIAKSGFPQGPHVHFIQRTDSSDMDGNTDPTDLFVALEKGSTTPTSGGAGDTATDPSDGDKAMQAAKAAGLLTTFQFPSAVDQTESLLLSGDKSLMNDQPLLPFVQELTQGALRSFMSLPNGDFYAFHPDYFGSFNTKPYWEIDDIEVLEASIQLTDDNLATHVYVTGSTLPSQSIDISRRLTTAGVVNVFNAGTADFMNLPEEKDTHADVKKAKPFLGSYNATRDFMSRYGARPYVSESTFIKSHIFETFYAFQQFMLMWSRQFLTQFTFTFMPELYPGGLVSFPVHGIQCYIEEVNHQWDYSTGFMTSANLSSPSALDKKHPISNGMVKAGIEGADDPASPLSPGFGPAAPGSDESRRT